MKTDEIKVGPHSYTFNELGIIINTRTNKELKGWIDGTGYRSVSLGSRKSGNYLRINVHRLLAEYFIPNPLKLPEVNHKDSDKLNNDLTNLEWVTGCENVRHAFSAGVCKNLACMDYALVSDTLKSLYAGESLTNLAIKLGISDSSTLRKLLKREATRQGQIDLFVSSCNRSRKKSAEKSYRAVQCITNEGINHYESLNSAARALGLSSGGSIHRALKHGREYKGGTWSYA